MNEGFVIDNKSWSAQLSAKWAGQKLQCFEELASTNLTAAELGDKGAVHGTLIVADKQTKGRGRRGRIWESPAGKNLYFTILLRPDFSPEKASMLTLVMAHSVARAVEDVTCESACKTWSESGAQLKAVCESEPDNCVCRAAIKWPNDILVNGKKVCGILTELRLDGTKIKYIIIGVGINIKKQQFPEELVDKASSLEEECGQEISREGMLRRIMECFEADYETFLEVGDLTLLLTDYHSRLLNRDAYVKVLDPKGAFEGIARGITETGELIVEKEDGQLCNIYAGEVSIRGLQGYT